MYCKIKNRGSKFLLISFFYLQIFYSQEKKDTTFVLKEVKVTVYPNQRSLFNTPAAVSSIHKQTLEYPSSGSLLPAMNSVPGVRMEERSPGSYRLSLRGSLIRSPFGVRNVKIYLDEFPFTDAGGNTYLNLLDASCIQGIEIAKGPDGSLFGANTGGVVQLNLSAEDADSVKLNAGAESGSLGTVGGNLRFRMQIGENRFEIAEAYRR